MLLLLIIRNSAIADKLRYAVRRQSRSPNMVSFYMLGMVSYNNNNNHISIPPSVVTSEAVTY